MPDSIKKKKSYKADIISITPTLWMRGRDERGRQIIQDYTASKWRRHENTDCVLGLVHIPIWQESGILIRKLCDIKQEDGWVGTE